MPRKKPNPAAKKHSAKKRAAAERRVDGNKTARSQKVGFIGGSAMAALLLSTMNRKSES